MIKENLLLQS